MSWKKVLLMIVLLAVGAYIDFDLHVPGSSIPITGQSIALLFMALIVNVKEAATATLIYLIIGGLGLPVFADGSSSWSHFVGGSGGFLYGFFFTAVFVSFIKQNIGLNSIWKVMLIVLLGTIVLFVFGLIHLTALHGLSKALEYGFYPFWLAALVKVLIVSLLFYFLPCAWTNRNQEMPRNSAS